MINSERLDRDWYEGIVQKLKWNVPIREGSSDGVPPLAPSRQAPRREIPQAAKDRMAASTNGTAVQTQVLS